MKVSYSISLKLTIIVVLLSTAIIFSLEYANLQEQDRKEQEALYQGADQAVIDFANTHATIEELKINISSVEKLNDTVWLADCFNNLTETEYGRIIKISVIKPGQEGYTTYFSTDNMYIGKTPINPKYHNISFQGGHNIYIKDKDPVLTVISPINISGNIVGTYEIVVSMEPPEIAKTRQIQNIIIISFVSILILVFGLLLLLRRVIVKPITLFRDKAKIIGKGNLETKVEIESNDEIGDLATAFNQMTKDLKESRDKIQDYTQILENLLNQKDEFIGQLGHDLKNPLQPLVGLLPIAIEQEKDPKIKEMLQVMNQNAEYMRDLIFQTLKLAKLRSANIKFDFANLNLFNEAKESIESQKLLLRENKISVENKINPGIKVKADKLRLAEVFKNLIANSVKYTVEGGGKITVDAKLEKNTVTVSIKDTGIGMNEEQVKMVFDEFYKADKYSSEYTSTGLGMSIAKRIIDKHDGKIWVESKGEGKGSTFYFTLKSK